MAELIDWIEYGKPGQAGANMLQFRLELCRLRGHAPTLSRRGEYSGMPVSKPDRAWTNCDIEEFSTVQNFF